jgi:hypothetical protein
MSAEKPNLSIHANMHTHRTFHETIAQDNNRFKLPYASKTLVYDNARNGSPLNAFGTRFIDPHSSEIRYAPAGMLDQIHPKHTGYVMTTKAVPKQFNTA